jgi:hypothetical protein
VARLTPAHDAVLARYLNDGNGLYIWADNDPFVVDGHRLSMALFGAELSGNNMCDKVVEPRQVGTKGFLPHAITTGLERFYEVRACGCLLLLESAH